MSHVISLNRNVHREIPAFSMREEVPAYVNYRLYGEGCDVTIRHVPFNVSANLKLSKRMRAGCAITERTVLHCKCLLILQNDNGSILCKTVVEQETLSLHRQ